MTKLQKRSGEIDMRQLKALGLPRQKREALRTLISDYLRGKTLTSAETQRLQEICKKLGV